MVTKKIIVISTISFISGIALACLDDYIKDAIQSSCQDKNREKTHEP